MNQGHPTEEDKATGSTSTDEVSDGQASDDRVSDDQASTDQVSDAEAAYIVRLVQQAQSGDHVAFHRLADQFQEGIFRLVYYRIRSHMDAEDLTQDIFFKAFRNLKQLKSPEVFRSWLYRIAVNRIRDFYRRKSFKSMFGILPIDDPEFQEPEEMTQPPGTEEQINRRAFWDQINAILATLPKMEKEVFLLRFFDDLSIREIGSVLKKNESTVKTHLYRALKKVRTAASRMDVMFELKEVL